jgi:Cysteine-rich secretory protein family
LLVLRFFFCSTQKILHRNHIIIIIIIIMLFSFGKSQIEKKLRKVAPSNGDKTRTAGGGYRSSLAHQHGARGLSHDQDDDDEEPTKATTSARTVSTNDLDCSWASCDDSDFHKHAPLLAKPFKTGLTRQGSEGTAKVQSSLDELTQLSHVIQKQRDLPGTWYYSSNHILVNKERVKRSIPALTRRIELDALARERAATMAKLGSIHHGDPEDIQFRIQPCRRFGENVACGNSVREIHKDMLQNEADRNNMLDRRYSYMGMGTAKGVNGELYFCQIFKG